MLYRQASAPVQPRFGRQSGRNQELNSRLQMKADELERLFAEHNKRRAHGGGGGDHRRREAESSSSATARGEMYERYMRKRESKLRKEWGLKREERAAAMEALRESLSSAELKLQQNPLRSTTIKRDRDQLVKKNLSEKKEEVDEEEEDDKQSDTSYKSFNSKLLPTRRSMSSSVGRSSNSSLNRAIPRPSAKATTADAGSARGSDVRKENTKPSSTTVVAGKPANFPRSKSTTTTAGSSSCKQGKPTTTSTTTTTTSSRPLKPLQTLPPKEPPGPGVARADKLNSSAAASDISGAAVRDDVSSSSPTASTASVAAGPDASCQRRKDTGKGIKRFLQFSRKKKGAESVASEASEVMSKSRSEYRAPRRRGFGGDDGAVALELQVQARGSSMAAASPANFKSKEDQSPRGAPRSFFSLPSFRNREGDSKLGR